MANSLSLNDPGRLGSSWIICIPPGLGEQATKKE